MLTTVFSFSGAWDSRLCDIPLLFIFTAETISNCFILERLFIKSDARIFTSLVLIFFRHVIFFYTELVCNEQVGNFVSKNDHLLASHWL